MPDLPEDKAEEQAVWRLQEVLRHLRDRLLAYGQQQEQLRRQRDANILEWVRVRLR